MSKQKTTNLDPGLAQLDSSSLEEVQRLVQQGKQRKEQLEALKAKGGDAWTEELQNELNDIVLTLVDLEEYIEERQKTEGNKPYVPAKGTEKMVHLMIVRGRRFNPQTGKEETKPYPQMFTFGEWQIFKQNYKMLGYSIIKVLHDPYNEAEVTKL